MNNFINNDKAFSMTELFDKGSLTEIMNKISAATGLAFVAMDYRGDYASEPVSYSAFCQKVQSDPERKKICDAASTLGIGQAAASQKPYIYVCPCGLLECAIPVIVNGQFLGGFNGGQIRCENVPGEIVRLENIFHHNKDYATEFFFEFSQMQQLDYNKFVNIAELVSLIVTQLSEKTMTMRLQQNEHEKQLDLQHRFQDEQLRIRNEREKYKEMESNLQQAQLVALRLKTDSFFLMNILNAISNMAAIEDAEKTNETVTLFAHYLSDSLEKFSDVEDLKTEIDAVERFLEIQKIYLSERLSYFTNLPQNMESQKIPPMTILPLIEFLLYFGKIYKQKEYRLEIKAEYEGEDVVITISDNASDLNKKDIASIYSMKNEAYPNFSNESALNLIRQRIKKMFGSDQYDITIKTHKDKGTVGTIRYPRMFGEDVL